MINSVRNTVLSILNKNNYGYLSPSDFNLFAKQAQLEIFKGYFEKYNTQVNKENVRQSGTEYADLKSKTEADIDKFNVSSPLTQISGNEFHMPSIITTGYECFLLKKILCYNTIPTPKAFSAVAERVSNYKIDVLLASQLVVPTRLFPVYVIDGEKVVVYPANIYNTEASISAQYIRYPMDPKWTYVSLIGGEPMFNQSSSDYQDFEIDEEDENILIAKILQYAGVSIREVDIHAFGKSKDEPDDKQQQR